MTNPTAKNTITPLPSNQKIVNDDGTPTTFFIRWAQERSIDISDGITYDNLLEILGAITVTANAGLVGGGPLDASMTIGMAVITGVAGTYTNANITVDNHGRVTAAANGTGGSAYTFSGGGQTATSSATNIIQKSLGVRTSGTLTFAATPTAGNTIVIVYTGGSGGPATPSGFTSVAVATNITQMVQVYTKTSVGTEISISVSSGDSGQWMMYEFPPVSAVALAPTNGFSFPFSITASSTQTTIFTFEQDSGTALVVTPPTGAVVDYNAGSSGGNHKGAIGHVTAATGTLSIAGTTNGSTNLAGVILITSGTAAPVTNIDIPGVKFGTAQIDHIAAGSGVTMSAAAGVLTINSSGGGGGGGGSNLFAAAIFSINSGTGAVTLINNTNVSSVVRLATGVYQINFTSAASGVYIPSAMGAYVSFSDNFANPMALCRNTTYAPSGPVTTTFCIIQVATNNSSLPLYDMDHVYFSANNIVAGGTAKPWYFNPPTPADLPVAIGSISPSVFASDTDVGLQFAIPANHIGTVAQLKAISGVSFTATMRMNVAGVVGYGAANAGLILSNGTKCWFWGWDSRSGGGCYHLMKYSTSGYDGFENLKTASGLANWFRVAYNYSTDTAVFSFSVDGKSWVAFDTETSISSYLSGGITGVGIGLTTDNYPYVGNISVDYWNVV